MKLSLEIGLILSSLLFYTDFDSSFDAVLSRGNKGVLHLYFDGMLGREITGFDHTLDWHIDDWEIRIGLGFKGKIDDLFILDSFLSPETIAEIYGSGKSLGELLGLYK